MRYIVDANVILNAAFIQDGKARRALHVLALQKHAIIVDEVTWLEALRVLERLRHRLRLEYDPEPIAKAFAAARGFMFVPPAAQVEDLQDVNRADRSLAAAAVEYRAVLVSDDFELLAQASRCGIEGLPTSNVLQSAPKGLDPGQLPSIASPIGRRRRPVQGHMFTRIIAYGWASSRSAGRYTAVDLEGRSCLLYDNQAAAWMAETDTGLILQTPLSLADQDHCAVCLSYRLGHSQHEGTQWTLYAGVHGKQANQSSKRTLDTKISRLPLGRLTIGADRRSQRHWNGGIAGTAFGAGAVGRETWRALLSLPHLLPSSSTADVLIGALQLLTFAGPTPVLPREADLR